jgi:predicted O-methyltransferase YrrM
MQNPATFETYFAGKELTTNWAAEHYHLWATILAPWQNEPVRILEIGSWEGRSALFFLNYLRHSSIVCVDTFAGSIEHRAWAVAQQNAQLFGIESRFDSNLAQFAERMEKRKQESLVALGTLGIERRQFDLIYIDGSHLAMDVYRDGVLAWPLVVRGGIMIFDDYQRQQGPKADWPHIGIDAFLDATKGGYEELHRGRQIVIRKPA